MSNMRERMGTPSTGVLDNEMNPSNREDGQPMSDMNRGRQENRGDK